jgi:hypothetical protein
MTILFIFPRVYSRVLQQPVQRSQRTQREAGLRRGDGGQLNQGAGQQAVPTA